MARLGRKRKRHETPSQSSSKALKVFVCVGTPIVLLQLVFVFQLMHKSKREDDNNIAATTATTTAAGASPIIIGDANNVAGNIANPSTDNAPSSPVGSFNGYPITYQESQDGLASSVHCIGESYAPNHVIKRKGLTFDMSWQHRSCQFDFFCYDLTSHEYVIFEGPTEQEATTPALFPEHADISQSYMMVNQTHHIPGLPYDIAIGGLNGKWTHEGMVRLKWYPTIRNELPKNFYALPSDVVMIPFHSLASFNPGHLVWDDFLPIYTLMHIFGMEKHHLLAMRYILPGDGLWASCDWREDRKEDCAFMLKKFGNLMVSNPKDVLPFSTSKEPRFQLLPAAAAAGDNPPQSNLVCARQGLAGMGSLTDHGTKKGHGWEPTDYEIVHNHGRGGQLWRFRNFMLGNLGIPVSDAPPPTPLKIIFSEGSSKASYRNFDWKHHIDALLAADLGDNVMVESYKFSKFSLKEQVDIISQAAIFVTAGGGGAVTATFLSRGASAIIFYGSNTGLRNGRMSGTPARLDYDYFNNMGYVRIHWVGMKKADAHAIRLAREKSPEQIEDIDGFISLIKHDLDIIRKERRQYDAANPSSP
ncbi:unnamed protein product [Cylindrotheca closterium]|uniref:Uncharacterized protein n=1 Tax=Cylindrotheca closterium TaxID=2856 RepID=A0AAD2CP38_9STRA|nr:unnamed protein product [Cylindrotheca closterium]